MLAWLSYRYIETPFRCSKRSAAQIFVRQYILPSSAIALIALLSVHVDGFGARSFSAEYKTEFKKLEDNNRAAYDFDYVCQVQLMTPQDIHNSKCVLGIKTGVEPDTILWGDSNAAHYIGMLGAFSEKAGFSFRNIQVGSCPPINVDVSEFAESERVSDCNKSRDIVMNNIDKYKVIIISASWTFYSARSEKFMKSFFDMVNLYAKKGKKIILIGKVPVIQSFDRLCKEKQVRFPFLTCEQIKVPLDNDIAKVNNLLKEFAEQTENVEYYDINNYLCTNGLCGTHDENGRFIYYDSSHLSLIASWEIGKRIISKEGVPYPFSAIRSWKDVQID